MYRLHMYVPTHIVRQIFERDCHFCSEESDTTNKLSTHRFPNVAKYVFNSTSDFRLCIV